MSNPGVPGVPKCQFITVETYAQQEKTINNRFSYIGQNVNKIYIFGYLGGPGGGGTSMIRLRISCFPAILSPISMCM